jgi:hypothetical protein
VVSNTETHEDIAWLNTDPQDIWIFDKLILARRLGYVCGPTGVNVPKDGFYIVRPTTNCIGLGIGTSIQWLTVEGWTDHLAPGTFWCEIFEGDHISVDYEWGEPILSVQGFKPEQTFVRWDRWIKTDTVHQVPEILKPLTEKYRWMNCEFIGGKLIEVHLRRNPDFDWGNTEFIPVWQGQAPTPPPGYRYVDCPEQHKRIGAWIK